MRLLSAITVFLCFFGLQAQPICDELSAGFNYTASGNSVQFANATTGAGTQTTYQWTFGDGNIANEPNPSHTYTAAGTYEVCLYAVSIYFNGGGSPTTCVDTACATVQVGGGDPCADLVACFEAQQTTANIVSFLNCTQPGTNTQYLWTFGDGGSGSGTSPTHTYDQPGTYTVCVTAYWNGCLDDFCETIIVQGPNDPCDELEAGFSYTTTPNGTQFSNGTIGTGQSTTWYWTFGDGASSNDAQPFHTYAAPGTYEVCLYAISVYNTGSGILLTCADTLCAPVVIEGVNDPCDGLDASFWAGNNGGNPGSIFYSASSGLGPHWLWSFGDGTYSDNGPQGTHSYMAPGTYELCLTVWAWVPSTQDTCSETTCQTVVIEGNGNTCDDLLVEFTSSTTPNGTQFTSVTVGAGVQTTWAWNFGDGSSGSGPNPFHNYSTPGTYQVCVTVTSFYEVNGQLITCVDEYCNEVVIGGGGNICDELNAGFTWNGGISGVQFSNGTTGTGFQTTWAWTFGDGGTSTDAQPFHTYTAAGVYQVCLVVVSMYETSAGIITCASDFCAEVEVSGVGPCNSLNACFAVVEVDNNSFIFENCTTPSTNIQYVWSFGDGTSESGANADHSYAAPGTYTVCLTAYWENCIDSTCVTIEVEPPGGCEPFEIDFGYGVQGNAVVFEATSSVPVVGFLWFFGDGADGSGPVITHIYEPPGPFNVCLAAWYWNNNTQDTCWAEHCELVYPFGVGMDEVFSDGVRIYPMPTHDAFTIEGLTIGTELRIFSPEGRLVWARRAVASRETVDAGGLAPAVYSVELRTASGSLWRRVAID
ncbi:MAG: PKD domain-containing protein [Flavobacteriales bacterium]|nr:PKD domain-containing protein [Flavobacteriales bacterium]